MAVKIELGDNSIMITGDNQKDIKAMNEPENLETINKIAKTFFKSRNEEQLEYEKQSTDIAIEKTRAINEIRSKALNNYCEEFREAERKMSKRRIFNTVLKTLITTSGVIGCLIAGKIINGSDIDAVTDIADVKQETAKKPTENKKK
jgi:hypothetical protein